MSWQAALVEEINDVLWRKIIRVEMVVRVFGSRIEFGTLDVATEDAYMLAPPCQRIEAWIHASQHVNMRDRMPKNCACACAGVRARFQPAMRR